MKKHVYYGVADYEEFVRKDAPIYSDDLNSCSVNSRLQGAAQYVPTPERGNKIG